MCRAALFVPPLLALLVVLVPVLGGPLSTADEVRPRESLVDARTHKAISAGFRYLKRTQNADGSWSSNAGKKINEGYRNFYEDGRSVHHVGVTSLAVLAFLAGGHIPGRGPYGDVIEKAIGFVTEQVQHSGYIASNRTRMYSHAFATLALAEVYGVAPSKKIKQLLEKAVEYTTRCQNNTGGWRYVPFIQDSDMSITVCQVVALRAAKNVGIKVPRATIARALKYVIESANTEVPSRWPVGSFLYQPQAQRYNRNSFSLAAAGLTTLFQAGLYDDKSLARYVDAADIEKHPPPSIDSIIT